MSAFFDMVVANPGYESPGLLYLIYVIIKLICLNIFMNAHEPLFSWK
jgi:hypothetical protein